jgi:hypothetical protein
MTVEWVVDKRGIQIELPPKIDNIHEQYPYPELEKIRAALQKEG